MVLRFEFIFVGFGLILVFNIKDNVEVGFCFINKICLFWLVYCLVVVNVMVVLFVLFLFKNV